VPLLKVWQKIGSALFLRIKTAGLAQPFDLPFDAAGNLYVSNRRGGLVGSGSVLTITPGGGRSVFANNGFHRAVGLGFHLAGNLSVSNRTATRSRSLPPTGLTWACSPALD